MARAITAEENLPPYAQASPERIAGFGFAWSFFRERKLAPVAQRVQVRPITQLAPPREVAKYATDLKRGDQMPPVIMTADNYLIDGHTRTEAARKIGWTTFPSFVLDVNYSDAPASVRKQLTALGASFNLTHGRGMSTAAVAAIIAEVAYDDDSPRDLAKRLHIPEATANTYLNAARATRRAEKVGVELTGTLTPSHLKLFGGKAKHFSDDVFREMISLAQDARLTIPATTVLAKRLEGTGTENERMALLEAERAGYHSVITGGDANPSRAAKLRQTLGFLNGQDDPAILAEQDPHAARMHIKAVRDARDRLDMILAAQERVERARLVSLTETE
jgi:hypothetical protein